MREIKFRAWNEEHKSMSPVVSLKEMFCSTDQSSTESKSFFDTLIFMQYIGLKDKNGKEIYEGDIVRNVRLVSDICGEKAVVEYSVHFQGCCFEATPKPFEDLKDDILGYQPQCIEIIGNIYENPELIK